MYFGFAFAQLTNHLHDLTENFFVPVILIYMYLIILIEYTTQYKIMIYEKNLYLSSISNNLQINQYIVLFRKV